MRFGGTTQWTPPPETRWDSSWSCFPSVADVGVVRYLPVTCFTFGMEIAEIRLFSAISAISAIFRYFSNVANTVAEDNADAGVWDTLSSLHFLIRCPKSKKY